MKFINGHCWPSSDFLAAKNVESSAGILHWLATIIFLEALLTAEGVLLGWRYSETGHVAPSVGAPVAQDHGVIFSWHPAFPCKKKAFSEFC